MKKIDKNVYQESKYGRKQLLTFSIIALILSIVLLGGGIAMIVGGATSGVLASIIWMSIVGAIMVILAIIFAIFSIIMLCTASAMIKVEKGSVKDGNRAIGTVNVLKCDKCGEELPDNATFCSKCGTQVEGTVKCDCGTVNKFDSEFCIGCGKKLK